MYVLIAVLFLFGQMIFIPTFLAATSACIGRELSRKEKLQYLCISPFALYIYGTILIALPLRFLPVIFESFIDSYLFLIELLGLFLYVRRAGTESRNKAFFTHLTFYLVQMSMSYVFESLVFTLIGNLILPLAVNLILYRSVIPRIRKDYREFTDKKWLISMPMLAAVANLFESAVYHYISKSGFLTDNQAQYFSAYNMVLSFILLALVLLFSVSIFDNIEQTSIIEDDRKRLQQADIQTIQALIKAIEAKDQYTNGHSVRVAEYAKMIALRSGWDQARADTLYRNVLLHDIGKIGIPDSILNSPGRLSQEDYQIIRKHPEIGAEILSAISDIEELRDITRHHHERYDGNGYPDRLTKDQLSDNVCIVTVADAYDAMTSKRSYRDIMPQAYVREEIRKNLGKQFHPYYGAIMLELIDEDTEYRIKQQSSDSELC